MAWERKLKSPAKKRQSEASSRSQASPSRLKGVILAVAVFLWPVFYLFQHVFPINGVYTAIGNDFLSLYFKHKVYLLANLAGMHFPLWSPSEAAGFPFYSNPFAQACYPFNALLAVWYKIFGGYSPLDYQLFTILGLSIFAMGLFMWLKSINKNIRAVLFATLVMSVSFKVTETIRFPNATHNAAWYPWILYAMTKIVQSQSARKSTLYGALLSFSLICLCTAGYPYFAYYSIFLLAPYLLVLLVSPLRVRLISADAVNWRRAAPALLLAGIAAGIICSPYILGVKQLVSQATDRGGKDLAYSTQHLFGLKDTAGSLVYPPAATTEGWYFFSVTALLIILCYLFGPKLTSNEQGGGRDNQPDNFTARIFFLVWFVLITYITYGRDSYLFYFLWKFMPGFSSLRVWGRLNIILVPIFAWMLSLAYQKLECVASKTKIASNDNRPPTGGFIFVLLASYAAVIAVQMFFYIKGVYGAEWSEYFKELNPQRVLFIIYGCAGAAAVFFILLISRKKPIEAAGVQTFMLAALVFIAALEMRHTGIQIWSHPGRAQQSRIQIDVPAINARAFFFPRTDYYGTITLGPAFNAGIIENWYYDRYVQFLKRTEGEIRARQQLLGVLDGRRIYFSEAIDYGTVQLYLQDAWRYKDTGRLVSYTGEELKWEIDVATTGYLSFIDNWDYGWKAWVDEEPAEIELLFGTFKSVRLTPGKHKVRFSYQPELFPAVSEKTTPNGFLGNPPKNGS
ncbi:MAG: hypothetical protein ABSG97_03410 [Sedimentisphaerales bacterium]